MRSTSSITPHTGDVKRFISRLWVKKRYSSLEENDCLLPSGETGPGSHGRTIEDVLPEYDIIPDPQCSERTVEGTDPILDQCPHYESQITHTRKRVHFEPTSESEWEDTKAFCPYDGDSLTAHPSTKHSKKRKRLRKAKKITWRVMKGGWKMFKAGIMMATQSPAVVTSTVTITNILHNGPADIHKHTSSSPGYRFGSSFA